MKMNKEVGLIAVSAIAVVICGFFTFSNLESDRTVLASSTSSTIHEKAEDASAGSIKLLYGYHPDSVFIIHDHIHRNESLTEILHQHHVSYQSIYKLAELSKNIFDVRKIAVNKGYTLLCSTDSSHRAKCFVYHPNKVEYVVFDLDHKMDVYKGANEVVKRDAQLSGVISSSLYKAVVDQGGSPTMANKLSEIYAWEIDFFGIQKGDFFKVIYKESVVNGEVVGISDIVACDFMHNGAHYKAFQFDQGNGKEYFDEEGVSLRKAFLKAPLSFTRISSHFSNSRLHPILKIRRPHHGIDYAAPIGTPVVAIGDGKVTKANYSGGAGNYMKIKHNSIYTTGYMHLQKFAANIKVGTQVKQGDIIGYVGSTGLSTGPHLDFRFWKNDQPVNPLKVNPPSVDPILPEKLSEFKQLLKKQLEVLNEIQLPGTRLA